MSGIKGDNIYTLKKNHVIREQSFDCFPLQSCLGFYRDRCSLFVESVSEGLVKCAFAWFGSKNAFSISMDMVCSSNCSVLY